MDMVLLGPGFSGGVGKYEVVRRLPKRLLFSIRAGDVKLRVTL